MVDIDPEKIKMGKIHQLDDKYDKMIDEAEVELQTKSIHLKISPSELARAKRLAAKKGLKYQTYIKMKLKEAMDADEKVS